MQSLSLAVLLAFYGALAFDSSSSEGYDFSSMVFKMCFLVHLTQFSLSQFLGPFL